MLTLVTTTVTEAVRHQVAHIVDYDWLSSSISAKLRQNEDAHDIDLSHLPDTAQSDAPTTATQDASKSPVKTANAATASKPRKRARNDPMAIQDDVSASQETEDQSPSKKRKDSQKASSTSLRIPVDEHCHLVGTFLFLTFRNPVLLS